jgi:DNA-binding MarR family transcriptional regulator
LSDRERPADILSALEIAVVNELRVTAGTLLKVLKGRLAAHGITLAQYSLLRELWAENGIKQNELSERLGTTQPATVVTIDSLEKRDLIRRERGTDDRRVVRIFLTAGGEELRDVLLGYAHDIAQAAVVGLPAADVERVRSLLTSMRGNLEAELVADEQAKRGA